MCNLASSKDFDGSDMEVRWTSARSAVMTRTDCIVVGFGQRNLRGGTRPRARVNLEAMYLGHVRSVGEGPHVGGFTSRDRLTRSS